MQQADLTARLKERFGDIIVAFTQSFGQEAITVRPESLREVEHLLADEPGNPGLRNLKAAVLGRVGEYEASIRLYRAVLADYPRQPKVCMSLGHALKTANQNAESIDAYRECIALAPQFGATQDMSQAIKLSAYSATASWVAGVFYLIPSLWILAAIAGLYSLYLFYLGLPILMKAPADKVVTYLVVIIVSVIVLYWITGLIVGRSFYM